ncbi:FtsK/SpoIIIE domain-containing protein [Saccharopolyspora phatthalungensis]|uniref:S-DNA-T family DNA segregation ATPase FtsK/SpoIIIE n=1 Tax=Saccharopolyspora phatthalungensis TaxID=664693 RepID=A0A840QCN1_9PSEU|nr:FtsK/SpoIIIE domain-containing protein [Saccharopolyspora phatthalungensis]MBB5157601.1 S-DNA-T family DNA segregation ATPase FtsK/SpoIIIE [Saccharopolyspora phatthalungensis]
MSGETLHAPAQSQEAERHIFDAELIDGELPSEPQPNRRRRFMNWWQRSPRVPAALKSWQAAKHAAVDVLAFIVRSPWRFVSAVGRGIAAVVRGWRRWVRVHDYRDAAEQSEKLADKFTEIRALTLFRWRVTGLVALSAAAAVTVAYVVYGGPALWIAAGIASATLAVFGRRKDGAPGRKPVLAGPRTLTWTMDPQVLVDAFRDAKLIGKDESLRLVERAAHDGAGWAVTVDLPATRKAADVIKHREALASALAVDELQLIVERVRGRSGHAGRVFLWVADEDPYSGAPLRFPLQDVEFWDAWRSIPFGRDARNRRIDLQLVWTSLVVGAIPRQGKTCATRLPAAGLILDPYTQLYVFDGKGGKDWQAAEAVAHRYVCGDEQEHTEAVRDYLVELVAEVQARFARMSTLDDEICPESKITPAISRDRDLGMPITAVIIDEVQVYLENPTRQEIEGKKITLGAYIADLLTYLARKGPAVGIVVILATQRPDSNTIPSRLRAVLGSRFALRVMDWRDSNIVLGEQMNTRGFDASTLLPSHKGVGILRPDGDTDAGADTVAVAVRTFYMDNAEWRSICERGRTLREAARTLTGHAAGDDSPRAIDQAAVVKALGSGTRADDTSPVELPEPLAAVVEYLGDDLDQREFVPTAELTNALDVEPSVFARQMGQLECRPTRHRVPDEDGEVRRVRGYFTADIRAAIDRVSDEISSADQSEADQP